MPYNGDSLMVTFKHFLFIFSLEAILLLLIIFQRLDIHHGFVLGVN